MISPETQVRIKLLLAVTGLILFFIGIRSSNETLRLVAIVLVVLAFLVRFLPRPPNSPDARTRSDQREGD